MPPRFQTAIRLDQELVDAVDRIGATLSARANGAEISRSEVVRQALARGIPVLEAELGLSPKPKGKRGRA